MIDKRKLRVAMVSARHNQTSLAKEMGCAMNTVSAKINNKRDTTITEAKRICEILKIVDDRKIIEIFFA